MTEPSAVASSSFANSFSVSGRHDVTALGKELAQRGFLVPDSDGKPQSRHKLPGMGTKRCYHLSAKILSDGAKRV